MNATFDLMRTFWTTWALLASVVLATAADLHELDASAPANASLFDGEPASAPAVQPVMARHHVKAHCTNTRISLALPTAVEIDADDEPSFSPFTRAHASSAVSERGPPALL
jgi:hypothetical protein